VIFKERSPGIEVQTAAPPHALLLPNEPRTFHILIRGLALGGRRRHCNHPHLSTVSVRRKALAVVIIAAAACQGHDSQLDARPWLTKSQVRVKAARVLRDHPSLALHRREQMTFAAF